MICFLTDVSQHSYNKETQWNHIRRGRWKESADYICVCFFMVSILWTNEFDGQYRAMERCNPTENQNHSIVITMVLIKLWTQFTASAFSTRIQFIDRQVPDNRFLYKSMQREFGWTHCVVRVIQFSLCHRESLIVCVCSTRLNVRIDWYKLLARVLRETICHSLLEYSAACIQMQIRLNIFRFCDSNWMKWKVEVKSGQSAQHQILLSVRPERWLRLSCRWCHIEKQIIYIIYYATSNSWFSMISLHIFLSEFTARIRVFVLCHSGRIDSYSFTFDDVKIARFIQQAMSNIIINK